MLAGYFTRKLKPFLDMHVSAAEKTNILTLKEQISWDNEAQVAQGRILKRIGHDILFFPKRNA